MILGKTPLGKPLGKDVQEVIARVDILTGEIKSIHITFTPLGRDRLRDKVLDVLKEPNRE